MGEAHHISTMHDFNYRRCARHFRLNEALTKKAHNFRRLPAFDAIGGTGQVGSKKARRTDLADEVRAPGTSLADILNILKNNA